MPKLTAFLVDMLTWLTGSWYFMLGIGIAHLHWLPHLPTVGYRTSLLLVFLFCCLIDGAGLRYAYERKAGLIPHA